MTLNKSLIPKGLQRIHDKIEANERITDSDALDLYKTNDLNVLSVLADKVRRRKNGKTTTYILNRYINYSNLCLLSCQFCAFAAKKHDPHRFEHSIDEIEATVSDALKLGITEIHMVGGLHPSLPPEWYLEVLTRLKKLDSALHLKAFTAVEIRHLAKRIFKLSIPDTLAALHKAGLGSLTGGGAEIFDPSIRDRICRGKETAEEWLEVHRTWHQMGNRSTCTMLYGHVESYEQRIDHMRQLRALQDETGGFTGFIPYAFVPEGTTRELKTIRRASAFDQLRTFAVSRIYLDNFDHLTAYWISTGLPLAQIALTYGADDLHGTIMEEKIFHMAGSQTPESQTIETLNQTIREVGLIPKQRNSHYEVIPS